MTAEQLDFLLEFTLVIIWLWGLDALLQTAWRPLTEETDPPDPRILPRSRPTREHFFGHNVRLIH